MDIFYEGVNITKDAAVFSAVGNDVSDGRCDSVDIVFEDNIKWQQWGAKPDDRIQIIHNGYDTGEMYIAAVVPEDGRFRILATAQKNAARRKARCSYENKTLEEIARIFAAECRMQYRFFGTDGRLRYPYLIREEEGCAAFLSRLSKMEGAVMKTYSGQFTIIDILTAQAMQPCEEISIGAKQPGFSYQKKETKIRTITVKTPYAQASATDVGGITGNDRVICDLPAMDAAAAGRWARGLLLSINRKAESITLQTDFHGAWSAMVRLDVTGGTEADGKWIIDSVHHDFVENKSTVHMLRCVEGIG